MSLRMTITYERGRHELEDFAIKTLIALDMGYERLSRMDGMHMIFLGTAYMAGSGRFKMREEVRAQLDHERMRHFIYRGKR